MEMLNYIPGIVTGLAAAIPLVVALINYVRKAINEKNWSRVMKLVVTEMATAETMFETGAERKEYVTKMVMATAAEIGYDIDMAVIGNMIDDMCAMSKVVNTTAPKKGAKKA